MRTKRYSYFFLFVLPLFILLCFYLIFTFYCPIINAQAVIEVTDDMESNNAMVVEYDSEQIVQSGFSSVVDFLLSTTDVYIAKGVDNSEIAFLSIRGFSNSRVAVFLDGMPVSLSQLNIMKIPLSSIEKIIIYKGNVSALFGPGAVGGAIIIITKQGVKETIDFITLYSSSILNNSVTIHRNTFIDNTAYSFDIQCSANISEYSLQFGSNDYYDFFSRFTVKNDELFFSIMLDTYRKYLPNDFEFPYFDTYSDVTTIIGSIVFDTIFLGYSFYSNEFYSNDYSYIEDEYTLMQIVVFKWDISLIKQNPVNLSYQNVFNLEYYQNSLLDIPESFNRNAIIQMRNSSICTFSYLWETSSLSLTGSIDILYKYLNGYVPDFIPSILLHYETNVIKGGNQLLLFALQASTGYRLPSFYDLYFGASLFAQGDASLKKEFSYGGEVLLQYEDQSFSAALSVFFYNLFDMIVWIRGFDGRWKPINFGETISTGAQLLLSCMFELENQWYLEFSADNLFTYPFVSDSESLYYGKIVPYQPLFMGSYGITLGIVGSWNISCNGIYRSLRYINYSNTNWFTPYFLLSIQGMVKFSDSFSVVIKCENILNQKYYDLLYNPSAGVIISVNATVYY